MADDFAAPASRLVAPNMARKEVRDIAVVEPAGMAA
jgi:hypothetical protein